MNPMTAVLRPQPSPDEPLLSAPRRGPTRWQWQGFSLPQLVVMVLAAIPPALIAGASLAAVVGVISTSQLIAFALVAGENPGMVTFGAMFLASPVQWLTGRSQVRVRKFLGMAFYLLAVSNGTMFAIERGLAAALGAPFLIAAVVALFAATPLFFTSSRRAQRTMGIRRWRQLHKLTYLIAVALVVHVALIPDMGFGSALILSGALARIPPVRRRLIERSRRAKLA